MLKSSVFDSIILTNMNAHHWGVYLILPGCTLLLEPGMQNEYQTTIRANGHWTRKNCPDLHAFREIFPGWQKLGISLSNPSPTILIVNRNKRITSLGDTTVITQYNIILLYTPAEVMNHHWAVGSESSSTRPIRSQTLVIC